MLPEKLKKVPVYDKQELLSFIHERGITITLSLNTNSGKTHKGVFLTISSTKKEGTVLLLKTTDDKNRVTDNILHISMDKIESIQFPENEDIIEILSKGKIVKNNEYGISGKLEVKKSLKKLSDSILGFYGIPVEIMELTIPADGKERNRIIKLTEIIEKVIVDILNEEDARLSWIENYKSIQFVNDYELAVKKKNHTLIIQYGFTDITAPEIPPKELTDQILSVL